MFKSAAEPKEADYTEVLEDFKEIFSSPGSRVFIFSFLAVPSFHQDNFLLARAAAEVVVKNRDNQKNKKGRGSQASQSGQSQAGPDLTPAAVQLN